MRTNRMIGFFAATAVAFLLNACSGGGGKGTGPLPFGTDFIHQNGEVLITHNGVRLGVLYVIGSCTGADDPDNNVISRGSDGKILKSGEKGTGSCPGSLFSISVTKISKNKAIISTSVGPLPVSYNKLSVPFDGAKSRFDRFGFAGTSYWVGCATTWSPRQGSIGTFDSIPTPCIIPGLGSVGAASTDAVSWLEIFGPGIAIRRTAAGGGYREALFHNHPEADNFEKQFIGDRLPGSSSPGFTYFLREEMCVYEKSYDAECN